MDILLYLLIAAFIGYVAYALGSLIFLDSSKKSKSQSRAAASGGDSVAKKAAAKPKQAAAKPKPKPKPAAKKTAPAKTKAAAKPAASKAKPKAAKKAPAKSAGSSATNDVVGFRNPDTGEEAKIPPSYPFSKRWVKDALVAEGLLDKIYKNTELDDANTKKVTEALEKLKTIEKYVVRE